MKELEHHYWNIRNLKFSGVIKKVCEQIQYSKRTSRLQKFIIFRHKYRTQEEGSPYKNCVSYVRRKIVDIGSVFQRRRGPTSTTIRVQFLHLLGNKGVITRKSSGRLIFMIYCVVKHNTSFPALRY